MTRAPQAVRLGVQAVLAVLLLYGLVALRDLMAAWGLSPWAVAVVVLWCAVAALGWPLLRAMPSRGRFAVLVGAAMVLRVGFGLLSVHRTSGGDPNSYLELAKNLLDRHQLGIWEPWFGGYWRALFPPLYPLLLAGWGAVAGLSTESLLTFNTLIDAAAALLIWRIGDRVGDTEAEVGAGAGRGAAWLYLIWPSALFSAPLAQKESLVVLLVLALVLVWLRVGPQGGKRWRDAAKIGALAGLLALTQPGEAPLAALFGFAMIGRMRLWRIVATGLRAAPFAILALLPWWVRNA
ncbi:MAG: glycosyltransferase, partial [Pseudomonadota bacterium]|nr:glycosyltransferase [Pseudomonadota bacterium]